MKLLALVSGGKDSILSMMEAVKLGHTIGCIANVYPVAAAEAEETATAEAPPIDEIDSHCFQTVGHSNIEQLAECLEIPLRRRAIREGQSVVRGLEYKGPNTAATGEADGTDGAVVVDEVEELYVLMKDIITEFPDITGVCSGAILSTYQRLRVENICERLGLQSFGYLWSMAGGEVLDLVAEQSVNAILIKVATVGLNPRKHLGQSLMSESLRELLMSLEETYQVHPAGEGGEFESFVLDCPLFPSKCLAIASRNIIIVDDNPISPTGRMEFTVAIVDKSEESLEAREEFFAKIAEKGATDAVSKVDQYAWGASFHACGSYKAPRLLAKAMAASDAEKALLIAEGPSSSTSTSTAAAVDFIEVSEASLDGEALVVKASDDIAAVVAKIDKDFTFNQNAEVLLSTPFVTESASSSSEPIAIDAQLRLLLDATSNIAAAVNRTVRMLLVFAPDLGSFAPLNKAYAAIVGQWALFPSRAFVGTGVSGRIFLKVMFTLTHPTIASISNSSSSSTTAANNNSNNFAVDTLRIQSISHWGAATIGPYGQSVVERDANPSTGAKALRSLVISGQIALTPSVLSLVNPNALFEAAVKKTTAGARLSKELKEKLLLQPTNDNDAALTEWRRFVAEFAVMLSNSLCPMMAMGPRESGDVWSANSDYAWKWLTTTTRSVKAAPLAEGQHQTDLHIYLTDAKHVPWAQWLWELMVEEVPSSSSASTRRVQPSYIVVQSLPRAGIVEMVTVSTFDTSAVMKSVVDDDEDEEA